MRANPIRAEPWEEIRSLTLDKVYSAHAQKALLVQRLMTPARGVTHQRFKQNLMEIVPSVSINYQVTLLVTRERGRCGGEGTVGRRDG